MKEVFQDTEYREATDQKLRDFHEWLSIGRKMILDMELHCNSLVGERFGQLVVVDKINSYSIDNRGESYKPQWRCKCDCDVELIIDHIDLINNKIKSCKGCGNE